jgi:hypothetical protein
MKKSHKHLILALIAVFVFGGVLGAQARDRRGEVGGVFIKLTERHVGERGYMGIVVRPFERDDHLVVLLPDEQDELAHRARRLREGDPIELSFMTEHDQMWARGMGFVAKRVERSRVEREMGPEERREMEIRREQIRRDRDRMEERRQGERRIFIRREGEPGPEELREQRLHPEERPHREPPPHEMLEHVLREVFTRHMEHMGMELREMLGHHIGRMHEELMELRAHTEHLRSEIEELRHENEMLRMKLRERDEQHIEGYGYRREPDRPRGDREARGLRDPDRPRGNRDREDREVRRDAEHDVREDIEYHEHRQGQQHGDRQRDEVMERD